MPAIYSARPVAPVTLDTWAAEIDAFISVTLEDFEAARLFTAFSADDATDGAE